MNTPAGLIHAANIVGLTTNATVAFAHSIIGYDLAPPDSRLTRVFQTRSGSTHFLVANTYAGGTLFSNKISKQLFS